MIALVNIFVTKLISITKDTVVGTIRRFGVIALIRVLVANLDPVAVKPVIIARIAGVNGAQAAHACIITVAEFAIVADNTIEVRPTHF